MIAILFNVASSSRVKSYRCSQLFVSKNWHKYLLWLLLVTLLRTIDRSALSIDRAAPSRDLLLAQASTDGAAIDGSRCAIDGWAQASAFRLRYRWIVVSKLPLLKNQLAPILPLSVQAAGLLHQYKSVNCYNCILLLYFRGSGLLEADKPMLHCTTRKDVMPITK